MSADRATSRDKNSRSSVAACSRDSRATLADTHGLLSCARPPSREVTPSPQPRRPLARADVSLSTPGEGLRGGRRATV